MESITSKKTKISIEIILILILGVAWHILLLTYSPLYLKKYPFENNEILLSNIYNIGDTLIFTDGMNTDMLIVHDKHFYTPRNRFGFDWEGWNILYGINVSNKLYANIRYEFIIYHDDERKLGGFSFIKQGYKGVNFSSSLGGYLFSSSYKISNIHDLITIIPNNSTPFSNKRDYMIDGLNNYKLTPKDGLVEYSFDDGRVYKLLEHKLYDAN